MVFCVIWYLGLEYGVITRPESEYIADVQVVTSNSMVLC